MSSNARTVLSKVSWLEVSLPISSNFWLAAAIAASATLAICSGVVSQFERGKNRIELGGLLLKLS